MEAATQSKRVLRVPAENSRYWWVTDRGQIVESTWIGDGTDFNRHSYGNVFTSQTIAREYVVFIESIRCKWQDVASMVKDRAL